MRKVAILVAVEDYADNRLSRVKYAKADALDLASVLQEHGFEQADQVILVDTAATKTTIESRVRKSVDRLTASDVLYFYYAGHGFAKNAKNYITCYDSDVDDLEHTSIGIEWLFEQFRRSLCTKIVLFLDACESGLLATTAMRGVFTDLTEGELRAFFESAEHCVCLAACKPGQSSYPADVHKHGIWTYHIIEALRGNAPASLERGFFITSASLQNYLSQEVPRTLRATRKGTPVQTPWMWGAQSSEFLIGDVSEILNRRKTAPNPNTKQLEDVRLYRQIGMPVRRLSGFHKGHRVPDNVSPATETFIARIASSDVQDDLNEIRDALRSAFDLKRRDLDVRSRNDGGGSIITPYFDYEVTVSLNPDNPSEVIWHRQVTNIREPDRVLSDEFAEVFSGTFDTLEFSTPSTIDLSTIVDQIEDLEGDDIDLDYDNDLTWCSLSIDGIDCTITLTPDCVRIVQPYPRPPQKHVELFFEIQRMLVNKHKIKQLGFTAPSSDD